MNKNFGNKAKSIRKSPKITDLRVISGRFRGQSLKSPVTSFTHPMGAREKLALFNMVNVEGANVLDAYAGSGALGIEALSRGAKAVVFVEKSPQVAAIIRENLQKIGVSSDSEQIYTETLAVFAQRAGFKASFEVILADPPYDKIQVDELQSLGELLAQDGILALSSPAELEPIEITGLKFSSTHTYAQARLTIYRK